MTDDLSLLADGELTLYGQIPSASNLTLVCEVSAAGRTERCVYKPVRGEQPLWDFPDGTLAGREVASYLIDAALGWDLIPPTVLRPHGPDEAELGPGMLQLWVHAPDDPEELEPVELVPADQVPDGYRPILHALDDDGAVVALAHAGDSRLHTMAVLDAVLNNADRKGGHILPGADGRSYAIDHGICLHTEPKLRTVLWGWAGEPIDPALLSDLTGLAERLASGAADGLRDRLAAHITAAEIDAVAQRARDLVGTGLLPEPPAHRAIPWPPF